MLQAVLHEYEAATTELRQSGITNELQILKDTHSLIGFPVNHPHTDAEVFTETIKLTRLHELDSPTTEFALAAYVHPFPNGVFCAWVYIAAMSRQ